MVHGKNSKRCNMTPPRPAREPGIPGISGQRSFDAAQNEAAGTNVPAGSGRGECDDNVARRGRQRDARSRSAPQAFRVSSDSGPAPCATSASKPPAIARFFMKNRYCT